MRLLTILLIFVSQSGLSQFGFDKIEHDFGDIKAGDSRVVDIKFRNTTGEKVYLLRIKHGREIKSLVSSKSIMPDSLLLIRIKFNPIETGKFKIYIPIYLSNSLEPFEFSIQGYVKEIDNSMGLACPSFDNKNVEKTLVFDFTATVLDRKTGEPIKDASITFVTNGTVSQIEKTNGRGVVKTSALIGLYYFVIDANKYIGSEFPKYINKRNDSILVYLDKPKVIVEEGPIALLVEEPVVVIEEKESIIEKPITLPLVDTIPFLKEEALVVAEEIPIELVYKSNNIVFLLDVSTSMNKEGKLDLLKASLIEMVNGLRPEDRITLISYSTFSKVILDGTSGSEKELLIQKIQAIRAQGVTAGGDGMKLAYKQAKRNYIEGGNNQVIMATDGKFNRGATNLDRLVTKNFQRGIGITVLGIKNKPENAEEMQSIANLGGGNYLVIESYEDSKQLLINEIKRTSRLNN
ncbi:MAG: VWA domain-containing protein [Flavobacteriales bacterium]|jgi:Ca-activated chloride channel family protein|tara:strand:+ start:6941 stop:8329 length:1389 start_codon:yes stop_codon:yes gene_type:complete